ncbi:MAG TPA: adenylyl-sulfate kinase [Geomonas sp.]|nr:adenylyl-sulfate kinase [Geomonas sp.]
MAAASDLLRFLACGSVDDGKSTLIGHLIELTGNLPDDQRRTLEEESSRIGTAGGKLDFSLLMDGLMAEREQGITIDVAHRYFETGRRKFIVADTPGHESYTRNMATGASNCSAALILVDATLGVLPQTRRHALICVLMGIKNLLFAVNKMDRLDWDQKEFRRVEAQCGQLATALETFGLPSGGSTVTPISALDGDNLVTLSDRMPWYQGVTVLDWLHGLEPAAGLPHQEFRLPVQYVIKVARSGAGWQQGVSDKVKHGAGGTFRAYAGTISSGSVQRGDQVAVLPAGFTTEVTGIRIGDHPVERASAGMAVSLTLKGEHDVVRGDCIAFAGGRPEIANLFKVRLVWMHEEALFSGRSYVFRSVFGQASAQVTSIRSRIDLESCLRLSADRLELNDIGEADISLARSLPFDPYQDNRETGAFILVDRVTNATVACGMILHRLRRSENVHWHHEEVGRVERAALKGQRPCVVWLTGLSGSGKSTIANLLERALVGQGRHTMLLDGDNVRHGLNKDLGFTEAARIENIRRIGEVAKLMTDAGLIVITAFISPFRAEREMVRQLLPEGEFIEVHLSTALEVCESRDPKGLYQKARQGLIPNFTGINAPYEAPEAPQLRLDTGKLSPEECCEAIINCLNASSVGR